MANAFMRGVRALAGGRPQPPKNVVTVESVGLGSGSYIDTSAPAAMKLSAVARCVEVLSGDIAKLPAFVFDRNSKRRVEHPLLEILNLRSSPWQSAFDARKVAEAGALLGGNGCMWILRDGASLRPKRLIGLPWDAVRPWLDTSGELWYQVTDPYTGRIHQKVNRMDMVHVTSYSRNGWSGVSVLERASEVIAGSRAAQAYNAAYYRNGGQPGGVLETDTDIGGYVEEPQADGTVRKVSIKDKVREEWEKRHAGPTNANRVAVLDNGLKYHPLSISQRDAQFVENAELSIRDIARFFGVPLYKLQEGKQSYNSNEQNAIEYATGTLQPIVTAWEQELTYKLLPKWERDDGLEVRLNMMAELRGDSASRAKWYRDMREAGAFNVNDIRELEDMPQVEGGDEYLASLNYVPLSIWKELSIQRNQKNGGGNT